MVGVGTILKVVDNSGARLVKCLNVLGVGGRRYGKPGDMVVVSVRSVNPGKSIKKGMVYKGVIVRVKKPILRETGEQVRFDDNGVVLLKNDGMPLGSRVLSPVMLELREKGFMKVISLATMTI